MAVSIKEARSAFPMDWIIPLEQAASDVSAAGGKGANLGALIEAGLPVPQGWVITTAAYEQFNQQNGVFATIEAISAESRSQRSRQREESCQG
jgi:phosphoenolpyruvate synthase/pyruvate phosphate dikinase